MTKETDEMIEFTDLPYEILGVILRQCEPSDWAALRRSCHLLKGLVDNDLTMYKEYYLDHWDDPSPLRELPPEQEQKHEHKRWLEDVKKFHMLERIMLSDDIQLKRDSFNLVYDKIQDLINLARPEYNSKNISMLRLLFESPENQDIFLCDSNLFVRARREQPNLRSAASRREMSAKLHCLHGKAMRWSSHDDTEALPMYPWACSKVYDLRNYTAKTQWGPFKDDGSGNVDWEMVEAIMIVLTYNLRQCRVFAHKWISPLWDEAFSGIARGSHMAQLNLHQLALPENIEADIYGVTGTWMRVVCFLDYNELFAYNFQDRQRAPGFPRDPLDTVEAIRMIVMHIRITTVEEPGPDDMPGRPVVHFKGNSRPRYAHWDPNAIAHVRGYVKTTREGEIQWTTFSIYHGEERWRSEGIQVGGLRSARGIVGCWFDKDYDRHGPAGPTAFWKISDDADLPDSEAEEDDGDHDHDNNDDSEDDEGDSDGDGSVALDLPSVLPQLLFAHLHNSS